MGSSKGDSALGSHSRGSFLLKKPAAASPCTASLVLAKNGDCCGEPAVITTQGNSLDSPCKAPFLSQKSFREQVVLENKQNKVSLENERSGANEVKQVSLDNPQNSHAALESKNLDSRDSAISPSSRADEIGEAIHNSAQAESNAINNAHKVRYLESVVGGLGGVRGDKGGELANSNPLSPLQKNSLQVTPESSENTKKVDSSMDCHALPSDTARNDKNNSAPKCHADKSTRNDRKNSPCEKLDSSTNAPSLSSRADEIDEAIHNFAPAQQSLESSLKTDSTPQAPQAKSPQIWRIAFLSVLYSGKLPKAPGTAGSALSVLLGLPILLYSSQTLFLLACLLGVLGVREIDKWEAYSKKHDEKWIVIDELVGVWLTMAIIGAVAGCSVSLMILAFGTFRLFDIWKPSIIGRIDRRLKGGLGVMLDDVAAGLAAGVFSLIILAILSRFGVDLRLW